MASSIVLRLVDINPDRRHIRQICSGRAAVMSYTPDGFAQPTGDEDTLEESLHYEAYGGTLYSEDQEYYQTDVFLAQTESGFGS